MARWWGCAATCVVGERGADIFMVDPTEEKRRNTRPVSCMMTSGIGKKKMYDDERDWPPTDAAHLSPAHRLFPSPPLSYSAKSSSSPAPHYIFPLHFINSRLTWFLFAISFLSLLLHNIRADSSTPTSWSHKAVITSFY